MILKDVYPIDKSSIVALIKFNKPENDIFT